MGKCNFMKTEMVVENYPIGLYKALARQNDKPRPEQIAGMEYVTNYLSEKDISFFDIGNA